MNKRLVTAGAAVAWAFAGDSGPANVIEIVLLPRAVPTGSATLVLRVDAFSSEGDDAPHARGVITFFPPAAVGIERTFLVQLVSASGGPARAISRITIATNIDSPPGVAIEVFSARPLR